MIWWSNHIYYYYIIRYENLTLACYLLLSFYRATWKKKIYKVENENYSHIQYLLASIGLKPLQLGSFSSVCKVLNFENLSHSDHSPILMITQPIQNRKEIWPFRFENIWLREIHCHCIVDIFWNSNQLPTIAKFTTCGEVFSNWGGSFLKETLQKLQTYQRRMESFGRRKYVTNSNISQQEFMELLHV